jgi:hypothetical protein
MREQKMPTLSEIRKNETGWNQAEAAKEFQQAYTEMHSKTLSTSYAVKRLSLIESGAADATELELKALASVYKRDIEEIRQAAASRQPETPDQTGEQFFAELNATPGNHDVLICSVYGGSRSALNDEDDEYGRMLIEILQAPARNVKLAMYLPFPRREYFDTRDENPDSMRLIAAYEAASAYAHDRFEVIRRRVPKGSIALYEPNVEAFLKLPGEKMQPYLAPFNIRQMLVVTVEGTVEGRVPLKKRVFAWTHDERPSGGTIPQDFERDSSLRQQMQAAWTAWMGEPLACWEQCGRLGDAPSALDELGPDKRKKFSDFRVVSKDEKWGWRKTTLSRNISEKYTRAERAKPSEIPTLSAN